MITNTAFLEAVFADMPGGVHTVICGFRGDPNTADRAQSARNWCGKPWHPGERAPYWYNGAIISSEIVRGLDIFELTPSSFISPTSAGRVYSLTNPLRTDPL